HIAGERGLARLQKLAIGKSKLAVFLGAVFDLSPFIRDCARRKPQALETLFDTPLDIRLADILVEIRACGADETLNEAAIMRMLRELKGEAHFLIALADLAGVGGGEVTVHRLSDLADACVGAAINFLL